MLDRDGLKFEYLLFIAIVILALGTITMSFASLIGIRVVKGFVFAVLYYSSKLRYEPSCIRPN